MCSTRAGSTGAAFRTLHQKGDPFILANAWDAGSAKLLEALGAQAIGTSSAAHAFTLGRPDMGRVSRDEALAHAQDVLSAVRVPVSGDFENGFGHGPEALADTVRLAGEIGLAGISIEDVALPEKTAYPRAQAIERIRAAASAARALAGDFVLCARADGVMNGQYDLNEALARVQGYEAAGADCVYVPVPGGLEAQAAVIAATTLPVNVLITGAFTHMMRSDFAQMGAARLSLGSSLMRMVQRHVMDAGHAMFNTGMFTALSHSIAGDEVDEMLTR
ncbi:MAG: isocitrate lyase/PEP mutase family protein [Maritimibacter sp.]